MKKALALLLSTLICVVCVPFAAFAAGEPGVLAFQPLALSDELEKVADGQTQGRPQQAAAEVPEFYDPDNPYFNGPQEKDHPDIGKIILHSLIGLVILVAVIVIIRGCLPSRKKPNQPPVPRQSDEYAYRRPANEQPEGTLYCTNCGKLITAEDRFCPYCGAFTDEQ